ncbi:hypothetical protein R6Q57_017252 [Mikania cordata]
MELIPRFLTQKQVTYDECVVTFQSPNGTTFWRPIVSYDLKPRIGAKFDKLEDVVLMYQNYAKVSRFSVCIAQSKKWKGVVTHKYVRCNKVGKPQSKRNFDTLVESSLNVRQSSFKL